VVAGKVEEFGAEVALRLVRLPSEEVLVAVEEVDLLPRADVATAASGFEDVQAGEAVLHELQAEDYLGVAGEERGAEEVIQREAVAALDPLPRVRVQEEAEAVRVHPSAGEAHKQPRLQLLAGVGRVQLVEGVDPDDVVGLRGDDALQLGEMVGVPVDL
jgi:hypothetical protein